MWPWWERVLWLTADVQQTWEGVAALCHKLSIDDLVTT